MPGKKRSGLANDRKAYYYTNYSVPDITSITLADIATYNSNNDQWDLKSNATILQCQTLTIPSNVFFNILGGSTFTNNGTINISGFMVTSRLSIINNNAGGVINNYGALVNISGIINNMGSLFMYSDCRFFNFNSGIFNNTGIIVKSGGSISNYYEGIINNLSNGIIKNTGGQIVNLVFNSLGGIINNAGGIIYNAAGGIISNDIGCTFTNNGIINNANGASTCGTGYLQGTAPITANGIACPP
jgi:hypothetical protein